MTELQLSKLLKGVQKPGRYTGGEFNSVIKNKDEVAKYVNQQTKRKPMIVTIIMEIK